MSKDVKETDGHFDRRQMDRRIADREQKQNYGLLCKLLTNVSDGLIILDSNLKILHLNNAAKIFLHPMIWTGVSGRGFEEVFSTNTVLYRQLITSVHSLLQTHFKYNTGKNRWIEVDIMPDRSHTLIFVRDIKENILHKEQIELINLDSLEVLERIADVFFALDYEWKFTYANKQAEDYFARKASDIIGTTIWQQFPKLKKSLFERNCQISLLEQKTISFETEFFVNKEWVEIQIFPGSDGVSIYCRDINDRKKLEREIIKLEQLNTAGEIAASIGHEIRNPLTTVRGFLQLLGAKEQYIEEKEYFELMISELDRANGIITEFLFLARNRSVDLRNVSLNDIIKKMSPLIHADAIKTDKEIILDLGEIPEIPLDEKEIRQLLLNLVRNGLEAMNSGGTLYIRTHFTGKEIILEVEDSGCGIPQELINKIGQPFITTKENGTGLGLSVCYSICQRHNGKIDFTTSSDGTTFYIRFVV